MNIKVIQFGIKLFNLVVSSIMPSPKKIGFTSVLTQDNVNRTSIFIKSRQQSFLLRTSLVQTNQQVAATY